MEYHLTPGIGFTETFSPMLRASTVRIVPSLLMMNHWGVKQIDVCNAFSNGSLGEDQFMEELQGFEDKTKPELVYKMDKALIQDLF